MPQEGIDRLHAHLAGLTFHPRKEDIPEAIINTLANLPGLSEEEHAANPGEVRLPPREEHRRRLHARLQRRPRRRRRAAHPGRLGRHEQRRRPRGLRSRTGSRDRRPPVRDQLVGRLAGRLQPRSSIRRGPGGREDAQTHALRRHVATRGLRRVRPVGLRVDVPHATIARDFPEATEIFKERGLWPTETHARGERAARGV